MPAISFNKDWSTGKFSNTSRESNNPPPFSPSPSSSPHLCTSANPTYSFSLCSTCSSCILLKLSPPPSPPSILPLTGIVFMHNPTPPSPPSPPLPDTVTPYITSSSPLYLISTIAHPH